MSNAAAGCAAACSRNAGAMHVGHAGAMQVGRAVSTVGEGGAAACRRHAGRACSSGMQAGPRGMQAGHGGGMPVGCAVSTAEPDACCGGACRRHAGERRCVQRRRAGCSGMQLAAGTQVGRAGPQNVLDPPKSPPKNSTKFG